jgi:hypothetical protein
MKFDPKIQGRWKLSLAAGIFSVSFIVSSLFLSLLGFLVLPVSLGASLIGLVLGVFSFMAKERKRLLAVPGMALSLVAPGLTIYSIFFVRWL